MNSNTPIADASPTSGRDVTCALDDMAIRAFNIIASAAGLVVLSPMLVAIAILVRLDSAGSVLFRQTRVGRGFRPFVIYKFRTMVPDAEQVGRQITVGRDSRVTRVGHVLRKTKADELPQLVNVLKGDMSLVGPRPEVPRYVEMFRADYEAILSVRPGITDIASLHFKNEGDLLAESADPDRTYVTEILPEKIRLAKHYIDRRTLLFDLTLILRTLTALLPLRDATAQEL